MLVQFCRRQWASGTPHNIVVARAWAGTSDDVVETSSLPFEGYHATFYSCMLNGISVYAVQG